MEPEVHMIKKCFQEILRCFTMTNVKCKAGRNMRFKLVATSLLLTFSLNIFHVPLVSSDSVDGWANMEILSFDGESIYFTLKVFVRGNQAEKMIRFGVEKPSSSGAVTVTVWRGISDIVYHESLNLTVFTYSYSYNHSYYQAYPKLGYLLFPFDEHKFAIFVVPSLNITLDEHPYRCGLPSQNYGGDFIMRHSPTTDQPFRYILELKISHSPSFIWGVGLMLWLPVIATLVTSSFLSWIVLQIHRGKRSRDSISSIVRISSAMLFFVPAFLIAFYNLKSPLPFVLSDVLMLLVIPWNMVILVVAVWYISKRHGEAEPEEKAVRVGNTEKL